MTLGNKRTFYRLRNNYSGWAKLLIVGGVLCYLTGHFLLP